MGKPNLVKDFCPNFPLDLDLDFGLGQAFQYIYSSMNHKMNCIIFIAKTNFHKKIIFAIDAIYLQVSILGKPLTNQ